MKVSETVSICGPLLSEFHELEMAAFMVLSFFTPAFRPNKNRADIAVARLGESVLVAVVQTFQIMSATVLPAGMNGITCSL